LLSQNKSSTQSSTAAPRRVCCAAKNGCLPSQNLSAYVDATTLEGAKQTIAQGPVASQMMIKHLGTNGGGFFNANELKLPYNGPF
jgi:K+-transporting ATPase A subunit